MKFPNTVNVKALFYPRTGAGRDKHNARYTPGTREMSRVYFEFIPNFPHFRYSHKFITKNTSSKARSKYLTKYNSAQILNPELIVVCVFFEGRHYLPVDISQGCQIWQYILSRVIATSIHVANTTFLSPPPLPCFKRVNG